MSIVSDMFVLVEKALEGQPVAQTELADSEMGNKRLIALDDAGEIRLKRTGRAMVKFILHGEELESGPRAVTPLEIWL